VSAGFDAEAFRRATDVSRETLERLTAYAALLGKWQRSVNLVSASTLPDLWRRHFLDSAQLAPLLPGASPSRCLDMGAGAGFPGMVLAVMGAGSWTLVEADGKKIAFLREVARVTGTSVTLLQQRLETLHGLALDVVTARACAPLPRLLDYAAPLLAPGGQALFLKGREAAAELAAARGAWTFEAELLPSVTDPEARIVRMRNVRRAVAG
jgi:16S rRNA (guanine527-N7)-methyltransferase